MEEKKIIKEEVKDVVKNTGILEIIKEEFNSDLAVKLLVVDVIVVTAAAFSLIPVELLNQYFQEKQHLLKTVGKDLMNVKIDKELELSVLNTLKDDSNSEISYYENSSYVQNSLSIRKIELIDEIKVLDEQLSSNIDERSRNFKTVKVLRDYVETKDQLVPKAHNTAVKITVISFIGKVLYRYFWSG